MNNILIFRILKDELKEHNGGLNGRRADPSSMREPAYWPGRSPPRECENIAPLVELVLKRCLVSGDGTAGVESAPDVLLVVEAIVDVSIESEWNRWYDRVHLPEILACPYFQR